MNISILIVILMITGLTISGIFVLQFGTGERRSRRAGRILAVVFLAYGALAFFAQALSATGGLSFLPSSFEWPLARVSGVVRDSMSRYIAPHTPSGRIQVYDQNKIFLRGWPVNAGGGIFKLQMTGDGLIEVFTARGSRHYIFRQDGTLVQEGTYSPASYTNVAPESPLKVSFKTPLMLFPFSHPFAGWALAVMGIAGLIFLDKTQKRAGQPSHRAVNILI